MLASIVPFPLLFFKAAVLNARESKDARRGGKVKGKQDGGRREWRFRAARALSRGFRARDDSRRGDLIGLP